METKFSNFEEKPKKRLLKINSILLRNKKLDEEVKTGNYQFHQSESFRRHESTKPEEILFTIERGHY